MKFLSSNKRPKIRESKITNTATLKIKGIPLIINHATFSIAKFADLLVSQTTTNAIGYQGENLIYVIKVVNKGPYKATGVTLTDILPSNSICKSIYLTQGSYKCSKNKITCSLGELSCNDDALAILTVIPKYPCILTNTTFITANEYDTDLNNNFFTTNTKICCKSPTLNQSIPLFWIILILILLPNIIYYY